MDRTFSWLLPDGVFDVLPADALKLEHVRRVSLDLLKVHGFELVVPPLVEYTETLLGRASEDLKRQTFKIIDQQNGRLMGIRADMTQQIARIDSQLKSASEVARYCYAAPVLRTLPQAVFESRTPFQLGAEIYGHAGMGADLELLDLSLSLLTTLKINEPLHVDLGHVGIFPMLIELHGVSDQHAAVLSDMVNRKAPHEISAYTKAHSLSSDFETLVRLSGRADTWIESLSDKAQAHRDLVRSILDLRRMQTHLERSWPEVTQSADAAQISSYHYHTALVFSVFGQGSQSLVRGGRYLGFTQQEQEARAAVGFSVDLAMLSQKVSVSQPEKVIGVPDLDDPELHTLVQAHRSAGDVVFKVYGREQPKSISHYYCLKQGQWVLESV